jgi:hypothetical protein
MWMKLWDYSDTIMPAVCILIMLPVLRLIRRADFAILFTYLVFTILIKGYSNYLADRGLNNLYLYHAYTLLEVILIIPYLSLLNKGLERITWIVLGMFIVFFMLNVALWESLQEFNSYTASAAALLVAFFCFRYLKELASNEQVMYFQKMPSFWIVSGFLFLSVTGILVLATYKTPKLFGEEIRNKVWYMQQAADVIRYILISIGIICCYRPLSRAGS